MNDSASVLLFDVGGTKLAAGVMVDRSTILCRSEVATDASEGATAVLERLIDLGRQVLEGFALEQPALAAPTAVGLASAGYIDQTTGIVQYATGNLPGWTGQPLAQRFKEAFGLPAVAANDAACFALAEAALGAGQGYRQLLVVAVGTGVGGGIVIDGQLYGGWQGRAGAIGHICVQPVDGRACTCGLTGCLEPYTATRIMVAESGYPSIQELAIRYTSGTEEPAVDEAALWLGRGLASLAHTLGPEAIVIGGSVGLLGPRYFDGVRRSFQQHVMPLHQSIVLLPSNLASDSGLLGAGLLARQYLAQLALASPEPAPDGTVEQFAVHHS
jgi:glucokinase